jgi:hypothetical protein
MPLSGVLRVPGASWDQERDRVDVGGWTQTRALAESGVSRTSAWANMARSLLRSPGARLSFS